MASIMHSCWELKTGVQHKVDALLYVNYSLAHRIFFCSKWSVKYPQPTSTSGTHADLQCIKIFLLKWSSEMNILKLMHSTTYHHPQIQPQLHCQWSPASTLALHWCQDRMNHLSGLYSAGMEWDGIEWNGILQGWFEFTRGSPVFISGMVAT